MFRFRGALPVLLSLWLLGAAAAGAIGAERQPLDIATAGGVRSFSVELADTPRARDRGLMYRRSLPADQGMLFDFGSDDQPINMWMANTYVPLDMIFIGSDGRIRRIAENAKPLSRRLITSGEPLRYVLEVKAGTARRLGIAVGDPVNHPAILPRFP